MGAHAARRFAGKNTGRVSGVIRNAALLLSGGISRSLSPFVALDRLVKTSGHTLFIPYYHLISDEPCPHIDPLYPVRNRKQFRQDLEFFLRHFEPVDLPEILERFGPDRQKPFARPSFHLTADDGLRQCLDVMAPLLREYGVPATFFINSGFAANRDLMYRYQVALVISRFRELGERGVGKKLAAVCSGLLRNDGVLLPKNPSQAQLELALLSLGYSKRPLILHLLEAADLDLAGFLRDYQPYLDLDELAELQRQGFHLGAHSATHPWYQHLAPRQRLQESLDSLHWLTQNLPGSKPVFAFPFSDAGLPEEHFHEAFAAGVRLSFGGPGLKSDLWGNLPRVPMERTRGSAAAQVRTAYTISNINNLIGRGRMRRPST